MQGMALELLGAPAAWFMVRTVNDDVKRVAPMKRSGIWLRLLMCRGSWSGMKEERDGQKCRSRDA